MKIENWFTLDWFMGREREGETGGLSFNDWLITKGWQTNIHFDGIQCIQPLYARSKASQWAFYQCCCCCHDCDAVCSNDQSKYYSFASEIDNIINIKTTQNQPKATTTTTHETEIKERERENDGTQTKRMLFKEAQNRCIERASIENRSFAIPVNIKTMNTLYTEIHVALFVEFVCLSFFIHSVEKNRFS